MAWASSVHQPDETGSFHKLGAADAVVGVDMFLGDTPPLALRVGLAMLDWASVTGPHALAPPSG